MPEESITFPGCQRPQALPNGWTALVGEEALTLLAPETDLRVGLLIAPQQGSMQAMAAQAWQKFETHFDAPVLQQVETPPSGGWEKSSQIVYNLSASKAKTAFAILRTLQNQVYIALVHGLTASVGRRMAQISEIIGTWQPPDLNPVSLKERQVRVWSDRQRDQLTEFVSQAMALLKIPGTSIAVVQGDRLVYAQGFGICGLNRPRPVTPQTRFMIGSSTKPLTSLLIARLIDQGSLSWSTLIVDVLPEFALADPEITRQLQMRHTMCACTGMPRRDMDFIFRFDGISPEQRLASMRTMLPTTGFGETFQYSNLLVALGGYAAARRFQPGSDLGPAYEQSMKQLIFDPLRMHSTGFLPGQPSPNDDAAAPHSIDRTGDCVAIDPALERSVNSVAPAGAAWSTALDIAKYLLLELAGGKTPEGNVLVARDVLQSRWGGGIKINQQMEYGLGLLQSQEQGLRVIGHGGNTLGFTSDMYFLPEQELAAVVLTNTRAANAFHVAIRQRLFEILFGADEHASEMAEATAKSQQDVLARTSERITTDPATNAWIRDYVGSYLSEELGAAEITCEGPVFKITFESWGSNLGAEIQPTGDRLLALTSPPWNGSLRLQTNGERKDLTLDAGQSRYVFRPL